MKPRAKYHAALAAAITLLVVAVMKMNAGPEMIIEGKPVSYWVRALGSQTSSVHAYDVLVRAGPKVLPALVEELPRTRGFTADLHTRVATSSSRLRWLTGEPVSWTQVRGVLIIAIGDIAGRHLYSEQDAPALELAMAAVEKELPSDANETRAYLRTLGRFGFRAEHAVPKVVDLLRTGGADSSLLFSSLSEIGPGRFAPEIVQAATNYVSVGAPYMKVSAVRVIGSCGSEGEIAVPVLLNALKGPDEELQQTALIALARIGQVPSELKPRLHAWIDNGGRLEQAAAVAMFRLDPEDATALAIIRTRLHPSVDEALRRSMLKQVGGLGAVAKMFEPELRHLAAGTNYDSAMARHILHQLAAPSR